MYRSSSIRSIALLILFIAIFGLSINCAANERTMGQALISADTQKAFVEASSSSNLVALLKKGDVVSIILRISTSGEEWCRIVLPGQSGLTGYVPCKALTSVSPVTPVSGTDAVQPAPAVVVRTESTPSATPVNARSLSNTDISEMSGAGLPAEVLIAKIKSSACAFDTAPISLKNLKASGVPDKVILAMIEAPVGQPRTAAPVAAPTTPEASNSAPQPSTPSSVPSDGKTRVLVTDSQSWETRGSSSAGGNRNGWGASSSFSGGARPQTAEIIKTLNQRCPQITVTSRLDKADFVITLDHEGGKALLQRHNKIAVFNKDGDVIFSKSTISLGNSVKDACQVMSEAKR
jgi:hypothetical protein